MTRHRNREAGLTLIEVLAVLAIVGAMAGVTMMGLGALDRGSRAEAEAMRLADRLLLANDEALISNAVFALVWDARGYRFDRWDPATESWRPSDQRLLGPRHTLAGALRLVGEGSSGTPSVLISASVAQPAATFVVSGSASPWVVVFDGFAVTTSPEQARDG